MKVVRKDEVAPRAGTTFTGKVDLTRTLELQQEGGMSLSVERFEDGARTHWHIHPGEQFLYVLEGEGRVGTETEEHVVGPGDVIYTTPGEKHWHGAVPGSTMTHVSVTSVGSPDWFEAPE
ncbi:MAG: cupin domain-containing protein [Thermomicrobiales bacterium]